jgi:uncharacterized membrane protein
VNSRWGPRLVTLIAGLVMLTEWFFRSDALKGLASEMKVWAIIVEAFTLALGASNLFKLHGRSIRQKAPGWYGSLFMFGSVILFAATGILAGTASPLYRKMYDTVIGPAGTTIFGLLCFFIFSAGARCIRFKNLDSILIGASILIVLVAQVPLGEVLLPMFIPVSKWMLDVVNVAVQRGMIIGAAFGAFAGALRTLAGLERGF